MRIRMNYRQPFRTFRMSLRVGMSVMGNRRNGLNWDENDNFSKVVIVILSKNIHRMQSIWLLCKAGLAKDAAPLLRAMFEELVDLKHMHSNRTLVNDYFDYSTYLRLKLGRALLLNPTTGVDVGRVQTKSKELEDEWKRIKPRFTYRTKKGEEKEYDRWTRENVRQLSERVGLGGAYDYGFGYLSNYVHSNPLSADDFVLGRDGDNVVTEIGASPQFVPEVLGTATMYWVDMLAVANEAYKLNIDSKLEVLSERVKTDLKAHIGRKDG